MNQTFNQEWTSSEIEKARSIITTFGSNNFSYDGINDDNNKKHDIVCELHSWFPWKTIQQVKDLYVDLVVDMLTVQSEEEYDGAIGEHGIINTMDGLVNEKYGVQEEASIDGMDFLFGGPFHGIRVMETEEVPVVEQNKVGVLENKTAIHQPMDASHARRFWTTEEHRLFLHGLCVYGRGKWKNISKYFVTTRTPVQVSSHAQKYFKKLENKGLRKQRYSINDVELDDVDQCKMKNSSSVMQAPAFADADYHSPGFGQQSPLTTFFPVNNIDPSKLPFEEVTQRSMWSEKHMMVPAAAPIEGAENLFRTS